jgi:hypothetical protein
MAMRGAVLALAAALALLPALLAGCSAKAPPPSGALPAAEPGSLAGVVVDQALRPVAKATVDLMDGNRSTQTDAQGLFRLEGVAPGTHFLRASHPLYDSVQQAVEVPESGAAPSVRILLNRVVFAQPYAQVQKFDGFLVCSVGFSLYASEECGEGVGVPCEVPQPLGCHRVGGQGNNHAQWDFFLDGPFARTLVVEMTWEPTNPTLKEFQLNVANDWTCDPFCVGNVLNVTGGPAPLYATVDFDGLSLRDRDGSAANLTADTRFSTFVWPNWGSGDPQQLNVAFNQPFTVVATAFYHLPAPPGWSFLAGDPLPA